MTRNEEIFKCIILKICKQFNIGIRQVKKKEDLKESDNIITTFRPKKIIKIKSRSF